MKNSLAVVIAALALGACAPAVEPLRVRAAELGTLPESARTPGRPLIIEFAAGDVIPIELSFEGDLLELTPKSPGLAFRAKQRFFVRMDGSGLAVSTDGVHFGERPKAPGSFRLGLSATREGTKVEVGVKMPSR